jgi:hypothetical protein
MPHTKRYISKKKNGHKDECKCPICINMKFAKRGGYGLKDYDDYEKEVKNKDDGMTDNIVIAKDEEYDMLGGNRSRYRRKSAKKKKRTLRKRG